MYNYIMSFLLVLPFIFIPGYLITLFFPRVNGFSERIGFSIATSISLGVVTSIVFIGLRFPLAEVFFIWNTIISLFLAVVLRKKLFLIREEWRDTKLKEKIFIGGALFISILAGVFILAIHTGYPWAIHADEWWQIGTVQNVLEGASLHTHPYLFNDFSNNKPGFSSYTAMLLDATGGDPVNAWPYMPALGVFFISFVGSLFIFAKTKSFLAGILLPIFFVALRSNAYSLGWWFFVPSMFALFFILVVFFTSSLWTRHLPEFFWVCLIFSALALVYFPFAVLLFLCFLPAIFKNIRKRRVKLMVYIGMFFLVLAGVYIAESMSPYREFWRMADGVSLPSFLSQSKIIQTFFVPLSATFHFAGRVGFFSTVPILLFVSALVGFFLTRKDNWAESIRFGFLIGIAMLLFGIVTGVSFFVFYQRLFYFVGIIVAILGTMGVVLSIEKIRLRWDKEQLPALWKTVVTFFLMATFFLVLFNKYFILPNGAGLYELVNKDDLAALLWLKENGERFNGMGVVANQAVGTLVTPLTRLPSKVSFLTSQSAGALINPAGFMAEEEGECGKKEKILVDLSAKILYAKKPQECPFLEEVYRNPSVFIYLYITGK